MGFDAPRSVATTLGAALFCAVMSLRAAQRNRHGDRRTWLLLGLAAICWAVGESLWGFIEVIQGRDLPDLSVADAAYLTAVPLVIAALLAHSSWTGRHTGRIRVVLDGLMFGVGALFVVWGAVIGEVWRTSDAPVSLASSRSRTPSAMSSSLHSQP